MRRVFRYLHARKLVNASRYKREWIAVQVGIKPRTLTIYLSGAGHPGTETIGKLAKILEVKKSELLAAARGDL